jgi:glycine/D-amino acid oxidase-like deaminating enzyme
MERRRFLKGSGLALAGLSTGTFAAGTSDAQTPSAPGASSTMPGPVLRKRAPLAPIKATPDRIVSLDECTRPFRPQGPRIEAERVGKKTIIHNYGHGGSGWSLSWGSGRLAASLAKATRETRIAVIGCGAIGLTAALMAQRFGMKVRIYTKEYFPYVRSSRATGVWSPGARIVTLEHATPQFRKIWEEMARFSYYRYSSFLGTRGRPIEWTESYKLSDTPFAANASIYTHDPFPGEPAYPHLEEDHTPDLMSGLETLGKDDHPFPVAHVRRGNMMMINIPTYARMLLDDFLAAGGDLVIREFNDAREFQQIPERTIIHSTGYAARALVKDDSLIPVRGRTARLIPQPEVDYGISYDSQNVYTVSRRDGMIVQSWEQGDYGSAIEAPDLALTKVTLAKLAKLFPA